MSNKETYAQCILEKKRDNSVISTTSYLPKKFAKKGWIVDLKNDEGVWDRGWKVVSVGNSTNNPPEWRKLIKGHRKMTGDNLPKLGATE